MKKLYLVFLLGCTDLITSVCLAVTVDEFYKESEFDAVKISPTGEYLAATVPFNNRTVLVVLQLSDMKTLGVFKPESETHIDQFDWVSNKRLIFNTGKKIGRLEQPFALPGLWAMDFDGANKKVVSFKRSILNDLPNDEDNVLIEYTDSVYESTYGTKNIYTGVFTPSKQASPTKKTDYVGLGYYASFTGDVLIHVAVKKGTEDAVIYTRTTVNDPWVKVFDEAEKKYEINFMGFSQGNKLAYFTLDQAIKGPESLISIDMQSHEIKTVLQDDNVNPKSVLSSPTDGSVYAVRFLDGRPRYEYLQPNNEFAIDHKKLSNSFPGQDVLAINYTKDGSQALYFVWSDKNPGDYYLYDRKKGKASYLVSDKRWIDTELMASTEPVQFKSRDGVIIEGFLTRPKNPMKNMPVIINPHGGPFDVYDRWGFDSEVQMLAHNGYAVLQVNYRGSGNHGIAFQKLGYKQWGKTMQDDLTDATHWMISQGYATPGKICIYGASYSGYAALMGAVREPDLYSCVIGNVGVYDLNKVLKDDTKDSKHRYTQGWWSKKYLLDTLGAEKLQQISPLRLASNIKAPVLLAAGELDYTAPVSHTKYMYNELKKAHKQVEMKIYANEGHGNFLVKNQVDWAQRLLAFLDKTIGSKSGK